MPKHPRGNRVLIRAINRSAVLNLVKTSGPISRSDIARRTGLSAATISAITAELIEMELIFEKEAGDSSGGRRPILLALNPQGAYVVGLKLAADHVTGALTDLEATVHIKHNEQLRDGTVETAVETMLGVVRKILKDGDVRRKKLLGVGIGLAGIVDAKQGILRYSPIFGWRDVPIADLMHSGINAPIYVDNDVNTLTLTENWFGAGQGIDNFLTVTIGRGVGLGIVVNGQIYRGGYGGAGEFGHTIIDPDGYACACGKRGCLETLVSDPALLRMAREATAQGEIPNKVRDIEDLIALAREGSPTALQLFKNAGSALGLGIANLITLFNPQLVIVSGEGARAGDLLFDAMHESIEKFVMPDLFEGTEIRIDVWDDDAWARGAASLVLRELFESPVLREEIKTPA